MRVEEVLSKTLLEMASRRCTTVLTIRESCSVIEIAARKKQEGRQIRGCSKPIVLRRFYLIENV
jgi:hypothetical protein